MILTFEIPAGTTSLTPYIYCNKHGLYTSPTVPVSSAALVASPGSPWVHAGWVQLRGSLTEVGFQWVGALKLVAHSSAGVGLEGAQCSYLGDIPFFRLRFGPRSRFPRSRHDLSDHVEHRLRGPSRSQNGAISSKLEH